MKQQFQAKHPWTILAAGAAIQVLTGIPAAWGVFQQPVMEYGMSEQGTGYALASSLRRLAWGASLADFYRIRKAHAAPGFGARRCFAADFSQQPCCRAAVHGAFFWRSASRRV